MKLSSPLILLKFFFFLNTSVPDWARRAVLSGRSRSRHAMLEAQHVPVLGRAVPGTGTAARAVPDTAHWTDLDKSDHKCSYGTLSHSH